MGIDNIELTSSICQSLFSDKLVDTKSPGTSDTDLKNNDIAFLGENRKKIIFLVNNDREKYLSSEELKVLDNLLIACKMKMEDIALVNFYPFRDINYEILTEHFGAKYILIFGISCSQLFLPFNIPDYQIQKFQEQIYLFNPPFRDLLTNKNAKMELWNCLKKMFLQ